MQSSPARTLGFASGLSPAATIAIIGAAVGVLVYGLLAFEVLFHHEYPLFGTNIYDRYYSALLEGRFDLPAMVLQYEGHYAPDGTGYLYHGVAPLLTRFALGWLVPLDQVSLAAFSVWFWACLGSLLYHKLFHDLTIRFYPQATQNRYWPVLLSVLIWFAAPGLLIAANPALFHEPVAVGYAASAGLLFAFARYRFLDGSWKFAVVAMAAWAALSLHARPNLAVGLYAATVLMCLGALVRHRIQAVLSIVAALSILVASGLGYLALNKIKFGDVGATHGSFSQGNVQYGPVFWGLEDENSERARAFAKHGKFNPGRIPSNLVVYALDPPPQFVGRVVSEKLEALRQSVNSKTVGFIRLEGPRAGFAFLWFAWFAVILVALVSRPGWRVARDGLPVFAGMAAAALLTLSYGTITLRYKSDLWPFVAAMAIMLWPAVTSRFADWLEGGKRLAVIAVLLVSVNLNITTAMSYTLYFREFPGSFFETWTEYDCRNLVLKKGLPAERTAAICGF